MDVHVLTSNTTKQAGATDAGPSVAPSLKAVGERWAAALDVYAELVKKLWGVVREPAKGFAPISYQTCESLIEISAEEISELRSYISSGGAPSSRAAFGSLMAAADSGEDALRRLDAAREIASEPDMIHRAITRMSRTYSDEVDLLKKRAKQEGVTARDAEQKFSLFASGPLLQEMGGLPISDADGAFWTPGKAPRGGISTDMYIAVLARAAASPGGEAIAARGLLERAKDRVLGTVAAAASEVKLHPIQVLGLVLGPAMSEPTKPVSTSLAVEGGEAGPAVDLSLPQSKTAVAYSPMQLIDQHAAMQFGPIATTAYGLNYNIVQRFRTITEKPIKRPASGDNLDQQPPLTQVGPLLVSLDAGETVMRIDPGVQAGTAWAPAEGPRPRVQLYGEACADIIRGTIGDALQRGVDLTRNIRKMQSEMDEKLISPTDTVVRETILSFSRAYDKAFEKKPPTGVSDIIDLFSTSPSPLLVGLVAAAKVKDTIVMRSLSLSDPNVAHEITRRESMLTALSRSSEAAGQLRRKVRAVYWTKPPIFSGSSPSKIREDIVDHFKRVVLPEVIPSGGVQILSTTAKVYTMLTQKAAT